MLNARDYKGTAKDLISNVNKAITDLRFKALEKRIQTLEKKLNQCEN